MDFAGVYLLPVDLEDEAANLSTLIEKLGGVSASYPDANIVASGSWAPKRIEREIGRLELK